MTRVLALDPAKRTGYAVVDGHTVLTCGSCDLLQGVKTSGKAALPLHVRHVLAVRPRHVILESPYAGDVVANIVYARRAMADSLSRGEAPLASHLLYTQPGVIDDNVPEERRRGTEAGLSWYDFAQAAVVYVDRGISSGMRQGIALAETLGVDVEYRRIGDNPPAGRSTIVADLERAIMSFRRSM